MTGWHLIIGGEKAPDTAYNRHSLTAHGEKRGKMAQTQNQGEVETFVTIASLSSSSALLIADQRGSADLIYLEINQRNVLE